MRTLRQLHLYLGCLFAPLIIYFSLSGVWQVFRFSDVPRDQEAPPMRALLHELSKPHRDATLPGHDPKTEQSAFFEWAAAAMGVGLILTASLGILIALKSSRRILWVVGCLVAGTLVPIGFLFLRMA